MADQKLSDLPSLNGADVDAADLLYIVDSSAGAAGSKKITVSQHQAAAYSDGTANGVLYFNGSRVISSSAALSFNGTNLATTGDVAANTATVAGAVSAASASISGAVSAASATFTGAISAASATVNGLIESTSGGFKFPDATTQTTAVVNPIPSGTVMLFVQTTAPTGWTKSTEHNDKALRVVSGSVSSGGSVAFSTAFASQTPTGSISVSTSISGTVGLTTLSTSQIPSHSHGTGLSGRFLVGSNSSGTAGWSSGANYTYVTTISDTAATGGSGAHDHSFTGSASSSGTFTGNAINLEVQYVDVIVATKD